MPDHTSTDVATIPGLLRAARGAYALAIAERLAAAGFEDVPRNGPFVLGGMVNQGVSALEMTRGLDVSKQAASQLVDVLVLRGYLTRQINPADRRRMLIELTDRGRAAAAAIHAAVDEVDAELARRISPRQLAGLRAGLVALAEVKEERMNDRNQGANS
ncbi:MAG TPA: MarR family transcriptional regulator [Actinocrinis sp.]|jgi:DNA-binding MarR family transcriptional regulator